MATQPQLVGKIILTVQPWMLEWVKVRECGSVLGWLSGLIRNERIAMKMNARMEKATQFCKAEPPKATRGSNGHRKTLICAEEIQKMIFLREVEGLSLTAIGERLNRSPNTVAKSLKAREGAPRVESPRSSARTSRGSDWKLSFGGGQ